MANPRKPPEARQRRHKPQKPDDRTLVALTVPAPPDGLTAGVVDWWDGFWQFEVVQATVNEADLPAVRRLAGIYSKLERLEAMMLTEDWIVDGSRGQSRVHPLFSLWEKLLGQAQSLEDRFGLNPKARLALGLQLGQIRKTLDDLNAGLRGDKADVIDVPDPRKAVG